ncbi:hypothetical protein GCM10010109_55020 [Actinoplanes campanulatus]|nr:hypothetical protein GCM10010109_55020 [Actinoplanes campanulatus]GID38277.1 hypothetical protein Aca09nite_47830 [Actinoplanes campanulatus]
MRTDPPNPPVRSVRPDPPNPPAHNVRPDPPNPPIHSLRPDPPNPPAHNVHPDPPKPPAHNVHPDPAESTGHTTSLVCALGWARAAAGAHARCGVCTRPGWTEEGAGAICQDPRSRGDTRIERK